MSDGLQVNRDIAQNLDRIADVLEAQRASGYRVNAFRAAARTLRAEHKSVADVLELGGTRALVAMPTIGARIAGIIEEHIRHGTCRTLDQLQGNATPEALFESLHGVGPRLAQRLHHELGLETLEELELAAHDGRLEDLKGIGPRRSEALRAELDRVLRSASRRRARLVQPHVTEASRQRPAVQVLLEVDRDYRQAAERGELRRIAPRRFNPDAEAWLPIWHGERDGWELTALFSNTARAHQLGRTLDWVVLYYEDNGHEGQCTVVTERRGPLAGKRVVRGREDECARYYRRSG